MIIFSCFDFFLSIICMMLYDTIILFCKITDNIKDLGLLDKIRLKLISSKGRISVKIVRSFWDHKIFGFICQWNIYKLILCLYIYFYLMLDIFDMVHITFKSINKLGLSWGSTRLRQLAWKYLTKLNIVFIIVFNIGLNIESNIGLNTGLNIGVQYWV